MPRAIHVIAAAAIAAPLAASAQGETGAPDGQEAPGCGYYAVVGAARSREIALDLQARLGAEGAGIIDHDRIDDFRPGFHSVAFGPYADQAAAEGQVETWRRAVPDAYVKFGCPGEESVGAAGPPARADVPSSGPGADIMPDPADAAVPEPDDAPAAADPSIELPLPEGVYVQQGVGCERPPETAFRVYDGTGIGSHTTRACRLTFEESDGETFRGWNSCENVIYGLRTETDLSVRLLGPEAFRLVEFGAVEGDFRLCANLDPEDYAAD